MSDIRFVAAPLKIVFDEIDKQDEKYKREYDQLSNADEDTVGQWLKLAKARGETTESDPVLLTLLIELHRKIDDLSAYIKDEKPDFLPLSLAANIEAIGFEHFRLQEASLLPNVKYYGRVLMPVFPKREIPIFFVALDEKIAKIFLIHDKDNKDWSAYLSARERALIREMKAMKEGIS
ncbi:hypothetical protein [Sulfurospirillum sp. 1612]|uniref:hypothetical protein n=1 Tax=Sulfurospirillum sp. 1612 TaxID=3094835 RepID=UPI002F93D200